MKSAVGQLSRRTYAGIVVVIIGAAASTVYFGLVLNSGLISQPAAGSSVLSDPAGDVGNNSTFLDVVSAKVVRSATNLSFSATVSGEIPKMSTGFFALDWFITSGVTSIDEPIIVLIFDPSVGHWAASVFAGRPPSASTEGLSFIMNGNIATVSVSLQTLGNPQTFEWHVVSSNVPFGIGIGAGRLPCTGTAIDRAPDSG